VEKCGGLSELIETTPLRHARLVQSMSENMPFLVVLIEVHSIICPIVVLIVLPYRRMIKKLSEIPPRNEGHKFPAKLQ
jgi:hypothetical protein